jgi:thiamine-phosphate pyrophosphorylase
MPKLPEYPFLYVITDEKVHPHVEVAKGALEGGAKIVQYREKNKAGRLMYKEAKEIKELCESYNALFAVNDRLDLALVVDADCLHLGQDDLPYETVRDIFSGILGVSVKNVEQAKKAENFADYVGAGAVFPTHTKDSEVIGITGLREIVESVSIPVVGIGGINANNVKEVVKAGASPAVVSSVAHAPDVRKATEEILRAIELL